MTAEQRELCDDISRELASILPVKEQEMKKQDDISGCLKGVFQGIFFSLLPF